MKISVKFNTTTGKDIQEIIKIINNGSQVFKPYELAAQYAYKLAYNPTRELTANDLHCYLEYLLENGAIFDVEKAIKHLQTNVVLSS